LSSKSMVLFARLVAVGIEYDRYQGKAYPGPAIPLPVERALIVGWLGRSRCRLPLRPLGRLESLYFAVGLGPETPCKLTAAPEAIPLSPRFFPGSPLRTALPL